MKQIEKVRRLAALIVLIATPIAGWADGPAETTADSRSERLAKLRARVQEQQQTIENLHDKLTAVQDRDQDGARLEVMRQQIREILSEKEFRESLMPSTSQAGYDNAFYLRSSDEQFMLRINSVMQFRWTYYEQQNRNAYLRGGLARDDRTGFDVQRVRLALTGNLYGKDLTYNVTIRSEAPDSYRSRIHYSYVNYHFSDAFQVQAGIFRLASTRAQQQSDQNFNMIDRPMTDAVFGLGIGTGVRLWGALWEKHVNWYLDVVNSLGSPDSRVITRDPAELDNNPAILFKTVWHVMGEDIGKDFRIDGDLPRHKTPALDLGFHYAFNDDQYDSRGLRVPFPLVGGFRQGGFGLTSTNGLQINQFGFESAFKYQGFSAIAEYIVRTIDPRRASERPFTPWWLLTNDGSTTAQHGAYVQAGYFLPIAGMEDKLEVTARVGGISALANAQEGVWEYSGGMNYYLEGNRVKLTGDVTKVYESPTSSSPSGLANVNDDALVFRLQLQVTF